VMALPPSLTHTKKKKDGILLLVAPCLHFHDEFTNTSWHVKHLLNTEALLSHAIASGDGGRTEVKGGPCWRTAVLPVQLGEN
jgi:hypothetical protein